MSDARIKLTSSRCWCNSSNSNLCPTCRFLYHRMAGFINDILFVYGNSEEMQMEEVHADLIWAGIDLLVRYIPKTRNTQRVYDLVMCRPILRSVNLGDFVDSVCKRIATSITEARFVESRPANEQDELCAIV